MSLISSGVCPVVIGNQYRISDKMRSGFTTETICVTWCEERASKWYFGFIPTGDSIKRMGAFGAESISKPGWETDYGVSSIEDLGPMEIRKAPSLPSLKGNRSYDLMM